MLSHIAHTFSAVHLTYYQQAAELDAVFRGFKQHKGEHYQLLRNWQTLPPYEVQRPHFPPSPLERVPDPDFSLERMSFTKFRCSGRDATVLHLAMLIERTNIQILMTRILRWYYSSYWESAYLIQLESDDQSTLSPTVTTEY